MRMKNSCFGCKIWKLEYTEVKYRVEAWWGTILHDRLQFKEVWKCAIPTLLQIMLCHQQWITYTLWYSCCVNYLTSQSTNAAFCNTLTDYIDDLKLMNAKKGSTFAFGKYIFLSLCTFYIVWSHSHILNFGWTFAWQVLSFEKFKLKCIHLYN